MILCSQSCLGWDEPISDDFWRHVKELRKEAGVGEPYFRLSLPFSLTLSSSLSLPLSFSLSLSLPFVGQVSPSFSNEVFERSGVEKVPINFQRQIITLSPWKSGWIIQQLVGFLPCSSAGDDWRVLCISSNCSCRLGRHSITWRETGRFVYFTISFFCILVFVYFCVI